MRQDVILTGVQHGLKVVAAALELDVQVVRAFLPREVNRDLDFGFGAGARIFYYPAQRTVLTGAEADKASAEFSAAKMDEASYNGQTW